MSDPNSVKIEPNVTSAEEAHATSTVTSSSVTVTSAASAIMTSSSATGTVQRTRLATIARENQASLLGRKENLRKELEGLEGLEAVLAATGMGNSSNGQNNSGAEATSNLDTYQYFSKWRFRRFARPW